MCLRCQGFSSRASALSWCGEGGIRGLACGLKRPSGERELDAALLRYEGTFEAVPLLPDRDPELVRNARVRRMQIAAKLCAADPSLVSAAAIARFHGIEQKECRPQVWAMLSPRDAPEALLAFIDAWTRDPQHPL